MACYWSANVHAIKAETETIAWIAGAVIPGKQAAKLEEKVSQKVKTETAAIVAL